MARGVRFAFGLGFSAIAGVLRELGAERIPRKVRAGGARRSRRRPWRRRVRFLQVPPHQRSPPRTVEGGAVQLRTLRTLRTFKLTNFVISVISVISVVSVAGAGRVPPGCDRRKQQRRRVRLHLFGVPSDRLKGGSGEFSVGRQRPKLDRFPRQLLDLGIELRRKRARRARLPGAPGPPSAGGSSSASYPFCRRVLSSAAGSGGSRPQARSLPTPASHSARS